MQYLLQCELLRRNRYNHLIQDPRILCDITRGQYLLLTVLIYLFIDTNLCGVVVSIHNYRSRGSGSILGAARFSEKQRVRNGVYSAL
jgi:hypothetical protein